MLLIESAEDAADTLTLELLKDGVQVVCFVLPEGDFNVGGRVVTHFKLGLWVLLQDVLDLFGPGDDGTFEEGDSVFASASAGDVEGGHGEAGLAFDLTAEDGGGGEEGVEAVHYFFGGDFAPALLVELVGEDGEEDLVGEELKVLKRGGGELGEHDLGGRRGLVVKRGDGAAEADGLGLGELGGHGVGAGQLEGLGDEEAGGFVGDVGFEDGAEGWGWG